MGFGFPFIAIPRNGLELSRHSGAGNRYNFQGDYFQISDLYLRPRSVAQPHPRIYLGGESDPARVLAAKEADVFFLNGRPLEGIRETIADVSK